MSNGNVTPVERRRYVETLDRYSSDFPQSVRPLLQLWRSNQAAQLDLSEARTVMFICNRAAIPSWRRYASRWLNSSSSSATRSISWSGLLTLSASFHRGKPRMCLTAAMALRCRRMRSNNGQTSGKTAAGG